MRAHSATICRRCWSRSRVRIWRASAGLGPGRLDLRQRGARAGRPGAQLAGEGVGGDRAVAGGEVFGRVQHVQRHLKLELGREALIMRAVSSHDCTYLAVVVRSSPFLVGGGRLTPVAGLASIIAHFRPPARFPATRRRAQTGDTRAGKRKARGEARGRERAGGEGSARACFWVVEKKKRRIINNIGSPESS